MKSLVWIALLAIAVLILAAALKARSGGGTGIGEQPKRKKPLSDREQAMYNRLTQALPGLVVLAQVSFGALLSSRTVASRNRFDRKIADFVVCDRSFTVLAVIELDDASHRAKAQADMQRDAMLTAAGYRVLRYGQVPDIDRLQTDFPPPTRNDKVTS